jgi:hypothetical protein
VEDFQSIRLKILHDHGNGFAILGLPQQLAAAGGR